MKVLLLVTCLATIAFGCSNTCPGDNGGSGSGQCQPVKIQYSANGVSLNVEVGCPGTDNCNTTPPTEYERCGSCDDLTYGRVPLDGDCSQFCECIQGQYSKIDACPNGLSFNAKSQVCDFPEDSGCSNEGIVTPLPPDDDARYCESCAGITFGFVAFERNCSKFCECLNGEVTKLKNCEDGLLFNKKISNCDYAENTDCQNVTDFIPSVSTSNPNETTPTSTPETTITPPGNTNTPTQSTPESIDGSCKFCDETNLGKLLPVEGDCTKFCLCQYYSEQEKNPIFTCKDDEYFNPSIERCVSPQDSGCVQN